MKVKELIQKLQEYPDEYEVKFATGPNREVALLSIYSNDTLYGMPKEEGDNTTVWFDLGEQ